MNVNTNNLNIDLLRGTFEELTRVIVKAGRTSNDPEDRKLAMGILEFLLGNFVEEHFGIKRDDFLEGAEAEIRKLLKIKKSDTFLTTPYTLYQLKLGHILGSKNEQIDQIYKRASLNG